MRESKLKKRQRALEVDKRLREDNPHPVIELDYRNPWELLVATILSAQSTDKMINTITPRLFERWPLPKDLAEADLQDIEEVIHSSGFYRRKAEAIQKTAAAIHALGGEVPKEMKLLTKLPGVGRKTANVVLGAVYGIPSGIVVDTHIARVSQRLFLSSEKHPDKIEADLTALLPKDSWIGISQRMVLHGRYVCLARKPKCESCILQDICPSAPKFLAASK